MKATTHLDDEHGQLHGHSNHHNVLLTGFGAFPGVPVNVSSLTAKLLAKGEAATTAAAHGVRVHHHTLPTSWRDTPIELQALLDELKPVLVLMFGVAHRAQGFILETQAHNLCREAKDAGGDMPSAAKVLADAPARHQVTLPVGRIYDALSRGNLPVELSSDAGGYLCNTALFHALNSTKIDLTTKPRRSAARNGARKHRPMVGFVHIPVRYNGPTLSYWNRQRGAEIILATCLETLQQADTAQQPTV
ncbi:MAG: hypothetical protein AAGG72_05980 [Pseudomonadota bacterium]